MRSLEALLIDFHTHTDASDGALSPQILLERARDAGISVLAITDHDTLRGFQQVRDLAQDELRLVSGVELSCVWGGVTIHVVGLGFDPDAGSIQSMVQHLEQARLVRAEKIAQRLAARGIEGALEGARAVAGPSQIGRPHFAQWMVQTGHVPDMQGAFDRYLGQGKTGDVKAFWPALAEAVAAITEAGGEAVLAHPLKYRMTRMKLTALCRDFAQAGGTALEIVNGRQTGDESNRLRKLAQTMGLRVSAGSDFHRDWQYGPTLGVDAGVAAGMPTVWDNFL